MIDFQYIWIIFPVFMALFIVISFVLTRMNKLKNAFAQNSFVAIGALLGFIMLALPFFKQPAFFNIYINYVIGIPITLFGLNMLKWIVFQWARKLSLEWTKLYVYQ